MLLTARANISRSKSLAPGSPRSRPLHAASGGGLRPALTVAASGAAAIHRDENRHHARIALNRKGKAMP